MAEAFGEHPHCCCCGREMWPQDGGLETAFGDFCRTCADSLMEHLFEKSPWRHLFRFSVDHFKVLQR